MKTRVLALAIAAVVLAAALPGAGFAAGAGDPFAENPATSGRWALTGRWTWSAASGSISSSALGTSRALWQPRSFTGAILEARVMLVSSGTSKAPRAQLVFAHDPATGAYRHVTLISGTPGKVVVGQAGTIGATAPKAVIASAPATLRTRRWYTVRLLALPDRGLQVSLGPQGGPVALTLTVPDLAAADGQVGFRSVKMKNRFDDFAATWEPGAADELCGQCHGGAAFPGEELAPNVMTYWNGSWWDGGGGPGLSGDRTTQQGGHGDPDNKPATACAGAGGCHDLRQSAGSHRDALLHDRIGGNPAVTENTYHLRASFIVAAPANGWEVQVGFDDFCTLACHAGLEIPEYRHSRRELLNPPQPPIAELGTHLTQGYPDLLQMVSWPIDSDLTTSAPASQGPRYAPCVGCHDPHGTGVPDYPGGRNRMLRAWGVGGGSALCAGCHI